MPAKAPPREAGGNWALDLGNQQSPVYNSSSGVREVKMKRMNIYGQYSVANWSGLGGQFGQSEVVLPLWAWADGAPLQCGVLAQ